MLNTVRFAALAVTLVGAMVTGKQAAATDCQGTCYGASTMGFDGRPGTSSCCMCGQSAAERAAMYPWHGNYAHSAFGQPIALVVPPTANLQTNWGWGVGSSRISRIDHQFGRNYSGPGPFGGSYQMLPRWPHDTTNFGVYYVRGPW